MICLAPLEPISRRKRKLKTISPGYVLYNSLTTFDGRVSVMVFLGQFMI